MALRKIPSGNALAKESGVSQRTISNILAEDEIPNPSAKVLGKIAKSLGVKPWMLLVPNFPFEAIKGKPLGGIHPLTYTVMEAMEREPETIKLLIMEAVSHTLCKIDTPSSHEIKEAQATYLRHQRKEKP